MQEPGKGKPVAAVVPGPDEDEHVARFAMVFFGGWQEQLMGVVGESRGGVLHEDDARDAQLIDGVAIEVADALAGEDEGGGHRVRVQVGGRRNGRRREGSRVAR